MLTREQKNAAIQSMQVERLARTNETTPAAWAAEIGIDPDTLTVGAEITEQYRIWHVGNHQSLEGARQEAERLDVETYIDQLGTSVNPYRLFVFTPKTESNVV